MINEFKSRYGATLNMQEFFISNADDVSQISSFIHDHFDSETSPLKVKITNTGKRSLSQNAFQHVIYAEISKYLISKGRTDWSPAYTKEQMKNNFLGWEDRVYTNVKTGLKSTHIALRSSSKLDKGEAMNYITQMLDWAESIGCQIKVPESCEYMSLLRLQTS